MSKGNSGHYVGTRGEKNYRDENIASSQKSNKKAERSAVEPKEKLKYNEVGSIDVKKVTKVNSIDTTNNKNKLGITGEPNSVTKNYKNGKMIQERYYDENGDVYLDIDYSKHSNPKTHPVVPHQHHWYINEEGEVTRRSWEEIKHD